MNVTFTEAEWQRIFRNGGNGCLLDVFQAAKMNFMSICLGCLLCTVTLAHSFRPAGCSRTPILQTAVEDYHLKWGQCHSLILSVYRIFQLMIVVVKCHV